jgi:hypothetical protein
MSIRRSHSTAHLAMSISDSTMDTACLPQTKKKRVAVVAFLLMTLFGFCLMFSHLRPVSTSDSFYLDTVDDRTNDALQSPQVQN